MISRLAFVSVLGVLLVLTTRSRQVVSHVRPPSQEQSLEGRWGPGHAADLGGTSRRVEEGWTVLALQTCNDLYKYVHMYVCMCMYHAIIVRCIYMYACHLTIRYYFVVFFLPPSVSLSLSLSLPHGPPVPLEQWQRTRGERGTRNAGAVLGGPFIVHKCNIFPNATPAQANKKHHLQVLMKQ